MSSLMRRSLEHLRRENDVTLEGKDSLLLPASRVFVDYLNPADRTIAQDAFSDLCVASFGFQPKRSFMFQPRGSMCRVGAVVLYFCVIDVIGKRCCTATFNSACDMSFFRTPPTPLWTNVDENAKSMKLESGFQKATDCTSTIGVKDKARHTKTSARLTVRKAVQRWCQAVYWLRLHGRTPVEATESRTNGALGPCRITATNHVLLNLRFPRRFVCVPLTSKVHLSVKEGT